MAERWSNFFQHTQIEEFPASPGSPVVRRSARKPDALNRNLESKAFGPGSNLKLWGQGAGRASVMECCGGRSERWMSHYTMYFLNAFLLSVVLIPLLNRVADRIGLVDLPHGRKVHSGTIPVTGGLAMFAAFMFPVMHLESSISIYLGFLFGLSIFVVVGVIDDVLGMGPWTKLVGQVAGALTMVLPGHRLIGIGDFLGQPDLQFPNIELWLTIVLVVGTVNAFNMIDGLDGLAGGAAASVLFWLAIVAGLAGRTRPMVVILLLLCAVLGFLVFNMRHPWRRQAVVFMGDAGSMMLGSAIAYFTINLCVGAERAAPLPALLWVSALPVFDTMILFGRRVAVGRNPLSGDRRHLHHMLLQAGVSAQAATVVLTMVCLVLGAVGLSGWLLGLPDRLLLLGLLVPFAVQTFFVLYGWRLIARTGDALGTAGPVVAEAGE
jgi:UDP-GlcNAc:undecaprenyl-phosphate GlcNAc-1-phosphate transferase